MKYPSGAVLCDFELCFSTDELRETLHNINTNGYEIVSVTQDRKVYTVFFLRPAHG